MSTVRPLACPRPYTRPVQRVLALIVLLLTLTSCAPAAPPQQVEVNVHCGLANALVEFEGELWRLDVADTNPNPPALWSNDETLSVVRQGAEVWATGPFLSRFRLIPAVDTFNDCL